MCTTRTQYMSMDNDEEDEHLISPCDQTLAFLLTALVDLIFLSWKLTKIFFDSFIHVFISRSEKDVKDHVIVITGAGHGFGKEMALILAGRGAKMALIDINPDGVEEVVQEIRSNDGQAYPFVCDVTNFDQVTNTFAAIRSKLGPVDILINNAGIVNCRPFLEIDPSAMERTLRVNVLAHFYTVKVTLADMISRGTGHIVGISSVAGVAGNANMTDYTASKHAIVGFMKSLDIELHEAGQNPGIKLSTVCPFGMKTGMFQDMTTRFPLLFDYLDPKDAASRAVHGILTDEKMVFVPNFLEHIFKINRLLPPQAEMDLQEFLGIRINPNRN